MIFIMAQPAIQRFKWELDVCLNNLKSHGVEDIILLFTQYDNSIPKYFEKKYGAKCFVYRDNNTSKQYIPSVKPYLWWQFLKNNPEYEKENYFYMDADVIFRELPDFSKIPNDVNLWVASDCDGYLGTRYIDSKGKHLLEEMCKVIGVEESKIRSLDKAVGAQWIMHKPSCEYWGKVYFDCIKLYKWFCTNELRYIRENRQVNNYTPIQKWTAEMWAQLWNCLLFGIIPTISSELDFCWATDDIKRWNETKIYHNAGVTPDMHDRLFFKGQYVNKAPFKDNLNFVDKSKCSYKYVEQILKTSKSEPCI